VAEAGFSTSRRGFSQDEVRAFLTSVAAELGRLQERERQLEAQLRAAETEAPPTTELDEDTVAALLGEETLRVLQTARESASQIKIRAEEAAAKMLQDADDLVNRLRQDAEVEVARKRHDASSDAEAEVALAKQQGREMVNEARAYRERVLADLERRTKLARQQIEDLVNGRDRLLQVFERARLVAVDVTSELQSIDGPAEFVNMAPTTGPLPLMVPASDLDRPHRVSADDDTDGVDFGQDVHDEHPGAVYDEARSDDRHDPVAESGSPGEVEAADASTDLDDDADGEAAATTSATARDANVVSLFRDRSAAGGDDAGADADVDGIFERLRSETPAIETGDGGEADVGEAGTGEAGTAGDPDAGESADDVVGPTPFSRRDEVLVPLIVAGARKLKRVLADEQNGVLDRLRQQTSVTALDALVAGIDDHAATYVDALAGELLEAAVAGGAEVGKNDTKTFRTTLVKGGALDRSHAIVRDDLVAPLRTRLERAIVDGAGDNDEITKRVRAVYREWKTQHIDGQLDDAFRFAFGGGLATAVKPGTPIVWSIDPSEPTCPDCEDNSLAGVVEAGEAFPTGHVAAPAHAGCRCLTVPAGQ
jgi:DivIVA domain-containing protein